MIFGLICPKLARLRTAPNDLWLDLSEVGLTSDSTYDLWLDLSEVGLTSDSSV
ncbi:hypothetical protein [Neobacillus cucumis]|uniref:hypothetical protein n=1 Tax=Neobacillus cucumis TaxID=1740721 RepID=UPI001963C969|nr:hypothetical protein [Neobacillus cucumis]MBM7652977.1 hypothetical protein [Neobacillus cucumis]